MALKFSFIDKRSVLIIARAECLANRLHDRTYKSVKDDAWHRVIACILLDRLKLGSAAEQVISQGQMHKT